MILQHARASAVVLLMGLGGCTVLEYSASKPLLHKQADATAGTDVFAIGAERRVVIIQPDDSARRFCSEPPPDVAQSFADSVRAALQLAAQQQASFNQSGQRRVDVPADGASAAASSQSGSQESSGSQGINGSGSLSLAREFATSISQIYTRSQGVQLFRDGSFMLCQAHLNHALRGDRIEELKQLALARESTARQLDTIERAQLGALASPITISPSQKNLDLATKLLPIPDSDDLNYSRKFTELLNTVHSVLLAELPNLYRYDVESAKNSAAEAAQRATDAKTKAAASAAGASQAETNAGLSRDQAAQSALKAADSSASAAAASVAAKKSADAAQAAASAAAGKK